MTKLIIYARGGNTEWARPHIDRFLQSGRLKDGELNQSAIELIEALNRLRQDGKPQLVVFGTTPTGRWGGGRLDALWEEARKRNPLARVAFAPPDLCDLSQEDRRSKPCGIVDRTQIERGGHGSLYEEFLSIFGED